MLIQYDPEADAVYVKLRGAVGAIRSKRLDESRVVDYDDEGSVVGVEFLFVSRGIRLEDVPEREEVADALASMHDLTSV